MTTRLPADEYARCVAEIVGKIYAFASGAKLTTARQRCIMALIDFDEQLSKRRIEIGNHREGEPKP